MALQADKSGFRLDADFRASANRKAGLPWYVRGVKVARTTMYSTALGYAADCIVSTSMDTYRYAL